MKDEMGDRMKGFYESRSRKKLLRRTPAVIRIDGRSFSTFCKRFMKPYDKHLHEMLNAVTVHLCKNIAGAKFAERHSDEISVFVTDYDKHATEAMFDYEIQKICSITASMATSEFTKQLIKREVLEVDEKWPQFDSRCFSVPKDEIANYFLWRIKDAERNSINMNARSVCSHSELQGLNCGEIIDRMQEKGFDWRALPQERKTGFVFFKGEEPFIVPRGPLKGQACTRGTWMSKPSLVSYEKINEWIEGTLPKEIEPETDPA